MKRLRDNVYDSPLQNPNFSVIPPFFRQAIEMMGTTSLVLDSPISSNLILKTPDSDKILELKDLNEDDLKSEDQKSVSKNSALSKMQVSIIYQKNTSKYNDEFLDSLDEIFLSDDFNKIEINNVNSFVDFLLNYPQKRFEKMFELNLTDFKINFDDLIYIYQLEYNQNLSAKIDSQPLQKLLEISEYQEWKECESLIKLPKPLAFSFLAIIVITELMILAGNYDELENNTCFNSPLNINSSLANSKYRLDSKNSEIYDCIREEFCQIVKKFQQFDNEKFNIHKFAKSTQDFSPEVKTKELLKSYCHECQKSFIKILDKIDDFEIEMTEPQIVKSKQRLKFSLAGENLKYLKELCECGLEQYQKLIDKGLILKPSIKSSEDSLSFAECLFSSPASIPTKLTFLNLKTPTDKNFQSPI